MWEIALNLLRIQWWRQQTKTQTPASFIHSCTNWSRWVSLSLSFSLFLSLFNTLFCVQVFTEYFKELEEESIQDNFVVVYELLDELMDFGFPQTTDSQILQE